MFWTRALPKTPENVEALRRNFDAVEVPDSFVFLASVMSILTAGLGFAMSIERRICVLGSGEPIPMMSYSLVEYLMGLDLRSFSLLEVGGGGSTPFWARRVKSVLTLETDGGLVAAMRAQPLPNVEVEHVEAKAVAQRIAALGGRFDAIIIDGATNRYHCAKAALPLLNAGGFIILDNSDWYPNAAGALREANLIQVDFHDFRPTHHFRCTASLFMHPEFRPRPNGARLPAVPIGGKDMAPINDWDAP